MISVVLDANVIVSGVLGLERAESTPGAIWRRWRQREFAMIVSTALIAEVERALRNPYFIARVSPELSAQAVASLRIDAIQMAITVEVSGVATHPEDDLVLAAAVSAAADYLVTGDKQLQKLGSFEGVSIVAPRDFLTIIERSTTPMG